MPVRRKEHRAVRVQTGHAGLEGDLTLPAEAAGLVLFAHGSGSSRHSPRNRFVARTLQEEGLATLLIDLLTEQEEAIDLRTAGLRFDIGLLAGRVVAVTDWLGGQSETDALAIGYFGASTGAAAALAAAVKRPAAVRAIVSRGGRPDLANEFLPAVRAPTLLIVGELDGRVLQWNREALKRLGGESDLEVVAGASHLFEEPGALEAVADLARRWFGGHLAG